MSENTDKASLIKQSSTIRPYIIAPVHDFATIAAAAAGKADEVYFGVERFSMRRDLISLTVDDLPRTVDICRKYNLKTCLTTNTVVYDHEMEDLVEVLRRAKEAGVDAVMVQDLAAMQVAKLIGINFHISTQCNVCNSAVANFYAQMGASRIVLARELSLEQIKRIIASTAVEIEVFAHGAMCFAYSGRCDFSQFFTGRLDNRGRCAQPCRRAWHLIDDSGTEIVYEDGHFFSAKDLCHIEAIPDLVNIGVAAFKIEGRRRPPEYVEVTSRCYREAVDAYLNNEFTEERVASWYEQLGNVFNRGFGKTFLYGIPGPESSTLSLPTDKSTRARVLIGEVVDYNPKSQQVIISLRYDDLSLNEEIIITGTETYCRFAISVMEIAGVQCKRASVGSHVTVHSDCQPKSGDKVYAWRSK